MKIIRDDCIYVQKDDIAKVLDFMLDELPVNTYQTIFAPGYFRTNNKDKFEFMKFTDATSISFFQNIPWIFDYEEISKYTISELINLGSNILNEKQKSPYQKEEERPYAYSKLDHQLQEITIIILIKQKQFEMDFPKELKKEKDHLDESPKIIRMLFQPLKESRNSKC